MTLEIRRATLRPMILKESQKAKARYSCILFLLVFGSAGLAIFNGCTPSSTLMLEREELFTLSFGKLDDQLDVFHLVHGGGPAQLYFAMEDGRFFISNGSAGKVMVFSSYGDLLQLYYNPEKNPPPTFSIEKRETGSNRKAFPYAFNQIGKIALSSTKIIYIEEKLPEERSIFDKDKGVFLNGIVLRFENGEYRGYLGQEGIGGNPFPFIERLDVSRKGELVVTCRTPTEWLLFWYTSEGVLKYKLSFSLENLPLPYEGKVFLNPDTIIPSPTQTSVYISISYFKEGIDNQTNIRYGIEHLSTKVFRFDLETRSFVELFQVPENQRPFQTERSTSVISIPLMHELVGILPGENFLFQSSQPNDLHQLLILQPSGRVLYRRQIRVEDNQLIYSSFHLSREGILSALLLTDVGAKVVWWRTDSLLKE
ncbi:MAG: hypothetical protein SNJ78_00565 [Spirochaetales bacterium]